MALARASLEVSSVSPSAKHSHLATTYAKSKQQMSTSEQYWAARALTAETMLTANAQYQLELRNLSESEQIKRSVRIFPQYTPSPRTDHKTGRDYCAAETA